MEREGRAAAAAEGLQELIRRSWRSVLTVVLLLLAVSVLVDAVAGIDLASLRAQLAGAAWGIVAVAFLVAQLIPVTQTVSTLGAAPGTLPLRPVYLLQLAQGYVGLAVPTSAARVAMNVRFFQKRGYASGAALAIGALDSFSGFLVEATLLIGLLLLTPQTLHFDVDAPSLPEWRTILVALVVLAVLLGIAYVALPGPRNRFVGWARQLVADGRDTLAGLRSPRRLALLFGGNLARIVVNSYALGLFAAALGTDVSLADLVVTTISVSLLAGLLPVPGGIGVVEAGLTFGLVAAGMPEGPAFAAVVLYRIATFYLPPTWGWVAFRHLERTGDL